MNENQIINTALKQPGYFSIPNHSKQTSPKQSNKSSSKSSEPSEEESLHLNVKKYDKNEIDSLQISSQESAPAHRIPSAAPSFEQISKGTKSKVLYPYLLEFQMNKCIMPPMKTHKIGKIISNYAKAY